MLRRCHEDDDELLVAGPVRMDVERHTVRVRDELVAFPLKEFELLELLLRNAGRVLTRGQLIDRIWGSDYVGDTKTLDVHVKRVRAKIEVDPGNPAARCRPCAAWATSSPTTASSRPTTTPRPPLGARGVAAPGHPSDSSATVHLGFTRCRPPGHVRFLPSASPRTHRCAHDRQDGPQ